MPPMRVSRSLPAILALIAYCLLLLIGLASCAPACHSVTADAESLHYLLIGMDEAAANADEILLLSYQGDQQRLYLLQLPRDTCCEEGGTARKINGLLPAAIAAGCSRPEALSQLGRLVSETTGLSLDGYLALDAAALSEVVDVLGGVDVYLPFPLSFTGTDGIPLSLSAGWGHLDGGQVMQLVRHRQSYATADLARLDVQKLLLQGLWDRLRSCGIAEMIALLPVVQRRVSTDLSASDLWQLLLAARDGWRGAQAVYATLPGEARLYGGVSYYVPYRRAAEELLGLMGAAAPFDPRRRLCLSDAPELSLVYERTDATYRIYTDADLRTLTPPV